MHPGFLCPQCGNCTPCPYILSAAPQGLCRGAQNDERSTLTISHAWHMVCVCFGSRITSRRGKNHDVETAWPPPRDCAGRGAAAAGSVGARFRCCSSEAEGRRHL